MALSPARSIFINLPVRDLRKSMDFFRSLGFDFNLQFTDENAACMVFSDDAYAMLLVRPYFETFTERKICGAECTEMLTAVSVDSREEVDRLVDVALAHGAAVAGEPRDHGFMYVRAFLDPDGHHWELIWMNPAGTH